MIIMQKCRNEMIQASKLIDIIAVMGAQQHSNRTEHIGRNVA